MKHRKLALFTIMLMLIVTVCSVAACTPKTRDPEKNPLLIATGELDGVFSPFFSTSAYDSQVVGMTQLSMLSVDREGAPEYGDDIPSVVKYASVNVTDNRTPEQKKNPKYKDANVYYTEYKYVIKNGIQFSDGEYLTYKDVLFNLYLYLDPVYNGSSTMYSTDIVGLDAYRIQSDEEDADAYDNNLNVQARERFTEFSKRYNKDPDMRYSLKGKTPAETEAIFAADLAYLKETFRTELNNDWSVFAGMLEGMEEEYTSIATNKLLVKETWQAYVIGWGMAPIEYDEHTKYSDDPTKIVSIDFGSMTQDVQNIKSANKKKSNAEIEALIKEYCVNRVYMNYFGDPNGTAAQQEAIFRIQSESFLGGTATGGEYFNYVKNQIRTEMIGGATSSKAIPSIRGITIVDLKKNDKFSDNIMGGIPREKDDPSEEINLEGTEHTADDDYKVLCIKIYGVDPKAFINFGFSVAPMHHYSNPKSGSGFDEMDGHKGFNEAEGHFGFPFSNSDYLNKVIKGVSSLPMGAGAYQASNKREDEDIRNVKGLGTNDGFYSNNIVYYIRNNYFGTTSTNPDVQPPIIKKLRLVVTNSTRLYDAVYTDAVHFADPTAKTETVNTISKGEKSIKSVKTRTNGYGYIGLNAAKIPSRLIRQAIMYSMDTELVTNFYPKGYVEEIHRPISLESWAYPEEASPRYRKEDDAGKFDEDETIKLIKQMVEDAGYSQVGNAKAFSKTGFPSLKFTFTIAGATSEHPTWMTMQKSAEILNKCGFEIKVMTDAFALRKLSSGNLTVWAAAWSSSIDPDMFQVYHRDSQATSVKAWGYPWMLNLDGKNNYVDPDEEEIIDELSEKIDQGRRTNVQSERKEIYADALDLIMDLAVELPTYQRYDVTIYKSNIIDETTLVQNCTAYYGPLSEIWSVNFAK